MIDILKGERIRLPTRAIPGDSPLYISCPERSKLGAGRAAAAGQNRIAPVRSPSDMGPVSWHVEIRPPVTRTATAGLTRGARVPPGCASRPTAAVAQQPAGDRRSLLRVLARRAAAHHDAPGRPDSSPTCRARVPAKNLLPNGPGGFGSLLTAASLRRSRTNPSPRKELAPLVVSSRETVHKPWADLRRARVAPGLDGKSVITSLDPEPLGPPARPRV